MTEEEWDRLSQEAETVAYAASCLHPENGSWGIESYGDAPAGIGGGMGGFLWFESREELLDFVGRLLTFSSPGPCSVDHGRVAREAADIVNQVRSGALSMDEGMDHLNKALRRFSQLRWWGQLQDLLDGERHFEKEIRAWARSGLAGDDTEKDTSPIEPSELDHFVISLREYGI
jgi:hypothetical protein